VGEGAMIEGSILFEGAPIGKETIVRNSIVDPGAIVERNCVVRGFSVLGKNGSWRKETCWIVGLE